MADNDVRTIAVDSSGNAWFGFGAREGGVSVLLNNNIWVTYNEAKGNLTEEEQTVLSTTLSELRMGYVRVAG